MEYRVATPIRLKQWRVESGVATPMTKNRERAEKYPTLSNHLFNLVWSYISENIIVLIPVI